VAECPLRRSKSLLSIYVKESEIHGFGVYASFPIKKGDVIEYCPFLSIEDDDVEATSVLQDYMFGTPFTNDSRMIAPLGYAMLYNHSDDPNAEWCADENNENLIVFVALKDIRKGTEITHDYGVEYWNSREEEEKSNAA